MPDSQSDSEPPSPQAPAPIDTASRDSLQTASGASLQILFERDEESVPDGLTEMFVQQCCRAAFDGQILLSLGDVATLELSVELLDTDAMRELNNQYRQKNSATNVLSFASGLPVMMASGSSPDTQDSNGQAAGGLLVLGDLVLCPEVVAREALEQDKPLLHHWAHMLVHGCLHLCGHDHEVEREAQLMEAAEIRILSGLGMPDPYAVQNAVKGQ